VANLLVEVVGLDQMRLRRALEVLSLAVGEGAPIGADEVAAHVPAARAHAAWELQDAVSARDGAKAVRLLRSAFDEGQEAPLLVGALFAEIRRLLLARDLDAKTESHRAAPKLGVPDWKAAKILANARRFTGRELRRAAGRLADLDVAVKRGADAPTLLEEWVIATAAPRS
jgi:DNA polymerase-3 subunit delta